MWKNRTNVGRVVYDRKPHFFTCKDVRRILLSIAGEDSSYYGAHEECFGSVWVIAFEQLIKAVKYTGNVDPLEAALRSQLDEVEEIAESLYGSNYKFSGGGSFGGGGATGGF